MTEKEESQVIEKPAQDASTRPAEEKGKEPCERKRKRQASVAARRVGHIFTIIFTLIFMYVINHLLEWGVPFLTDGFRICLWVINTSLAVSVVGNALLLAYDARWFRHIIQIILNIFAFVAVYIVYAIFPFAFPEAIWAMLARFVLIIMMIGIGIGLIVEFVKLVLNRE